ncbi:MAG TPA: neutral zinc metallopeptidase [Ilumatobacteraceae bacterium]
MTKIRSRSSTRVRDVRGSGGGGMSFPGLGGRGGGGLPIPMGAGGGILGLLVILAIVFLPRLLGGGQGAVSSPDANQSDSSGPTACESEIEQIVCGAVDDVILYWDEQYPQSFQGAFPATDTVFFSDVVNTGCGQAPAETGPFYCPLDQLVYFDLDFLQQLQSQFGASGDLAAQYIVAHEYGHHVQNVTGISDRVRQLQEQNPSVANDFSVALELQADCFAGAWASSIEDNEFSNEGEIAEALNAAEAVGDDRIMEQAGREVDPDSFTHGSAEQRRQWFERGFTTADPEQCTTFNDALAP